MVLALPSIDGTHVVNICDEIYSKIYRFIKKGLVRRRPSMYISQHHLRILPLHIFQLLLITLLPRINLIHPLNDLSMLLTPWLNGCAIRHRARHNARFESQFRFHHLAILNRFRDVEDGEDLCDGDEEGVIGYMRTRADATTISKSEFAGFRLRGLGGESVGIEVHWFGIDGGIVCEPPVMLLVDARQR